MRLRRRSISEEPLINLTPLIDVVFVVLIVFILVAPMVNIDPISLAPKTQAQSRAIDEKKQLVLRLHADGTLAIGRKVIPESKREKALADLMRADKKALLLCDKRATFGSYQAVKDALESAGFEELEIAVSPRK